MQHFSNFIFSNFIRELEKNAYTVVNNCHVNWCHQMSDFEDNMHQIRFPLGSALDAAGSLQCFRYLMGLFLRGGMGGERDRREGRKGGEG